MLELLNSLKPLFPLTTVAKAQAASALVCRQVIRDNPIPSPEEMDNEFAEVM